MLGLPKFKSIEYYISCKTYFDFIKKYLKLFCITYFEVVSYFGFFAYAYKYFKMDVYAKKLKYDTTSKWVIEKSFSYFFTKSTYVLDQV